MRAAIARSSSAISAILACTSASPWMRASSGLSFAALLRSRIVSCIAASSSSLNTSPDALALLPRFLVASVSVMRTRPFEEDPTGFGRDALPSERRE